MMTAPTAIDPSKVLLKPEEAAKVLSIGRTVLYSLVRSGEVESVKIGHLRRFRRCDLENYAAQLKTAAI